MKLVTWNIQWCRGVDGRVDPARIVAHARRLADFDVLCLQEVDDGHEALDACSDADQFAQLAALLPGYTAVAGIAVDAPAEGAGAEPSAPRRTRKRFGNLVLSRLPLGQVRRLELPWPSDPGVRSMPRVLVEAVVHAPFGPLRVMTTHLEYYSALQRLAQIDAIRARHAESARRAVDSQRHTPAERGGGPFHAHPGAASAVLCGDFNHPPEGPEHQRLQAPFVDADVPRLVDAWSLAHPGTPHAHTIGVHDRVQWERSYACDFVFVTDDLAARVRQVVIDGDTQASDHQPVLLELG